MKFVKFTLVLSLALSLSACAEDDYKQNYCQRLSWQKQGHPVELPEPEEYGLNKDYPTPSCN